MKRLQPFYYLPLLLTLFSCTLSLDEYTIPEEEEGFDEPVTLETNEGTVTYQFNDGVIYVTDNLQDYLERVEADTILYFSPDLPKKYRPEVGSMLAAGISHKLHYGLNHRVIAVEQQGGLLRVECTKASIDDVYKELDYDIDMLVTTPDIVGADSATLASMGFEVYDSVYFDWRTYDARKKAKEARKTRADDDEPDGDGDKVSTDKWLDFYFDTRDIDGLITGIGQSATFIKSYIWAIKDQLAREGKDSRFSGEFYVGANVQCTNYTRAHAKRIKDQKYEEQWTDTWSDWKLAVEAGYEYSKKADRSKLTRDAIAKREKEWTYNLVGALSEINEDKSGFLGPQDLAKNASKRSFGTAEFRLPFMIGPVPCAFILTASLTPEITIGGSVNASVGYTTAKVRTGFIAKDGKSTNIRDEIIEKGKFHFDSFGIKGKIKVGASARAAAGIEIAGTFGCTVGANIDAFLEGEGNVNIVDNTGDETQFMKTDGKLRFYTDFYGDIQLHVAPLGVHLWDKQVATFLTKNLINYSTKFEPVIYFASGKCFTSDGAYFAQTHYVLKDLQGVNALLSWKTYYPGMRMYLGPVKEKRWHYMKLVDTNENELGRGTPVKANQTYYFKSVDLYDSDDILEVHFVPVLCSYADAGYIDSEIICEEDVACEIGDPKLFTKQTIQTYGAPLNEFDFTYLDDNNGYIDTKDGASGPSSVDPSTLREYKFITKVEVRNGARLSKWGVKVKIYSPDGKQLLSKRVPVNKLKTGVYTLVFHFATNWALKSSNETMYYKVTPYGTDINGGRNFEATDGPSVAEHMILYDVQPDLTPVKPKKGESEWGEIQPVVELN